MKIISIFGTRPEIIRLSRIFPLLDANFQHVMVNTNQNFTPELNSIFFSELNIRKPDYTLKINTGKFGVEVGEIISQTEKIIMKEKPEVMLILGDTNSCLSAIAAKKKKIPIFHYEAGNRCFDQRVPEETNRKIVDHIADINLTYSSIARDYLLKEGLNPDRTIKIGSPMYEVLNSQKKEIANSKILKKLQLEAGKYFLISCHREENVDNEKNFNLLIESLNELANKYKMPIIFPIHPRTKNIYNKSKLKVNKLVNFIDPLGFIDYNKLQIESFVVLSDSGTIFEESSILNFRALNIRESHERPEALEETSVVVTGLKIERILQGINILENQTTGKKRNINLVSDYNISNISLKIERIILSHIDFVNRVVWQKES